MKKAAVILAEGFEEVEALTTVDFLRRAGVQVDLLGVGGTEITGGHGITVRADVNVSEYRVVPECVVVPGGMPGAENISASTEAVTLINVVSNSDGLVAAICAAPAVVLAAHGLLDGKQATCYPGFEERFPEGAIFRSDRVVQDGDLITSRGPGTAAEFAIAIVSRLCGDDAAATLAESTLQPTA